MDSPKPNSRIHPLVAGAAVAVTLASLIGVAAMTGLLPSSQGSNPTSVAGMSAAPSDNYSQQQLAPAMGNGAQAGYQNGNYAPVPAPTQRSTPRQDYAAEPRQEPQYAQAAQPSICRSCGRVESVHAFEHAAKPSGVGIAAGAVLGGILGHQVGHGNGNTLATVAGAVGGGFAGNEVEKRTHTTTTYQVNVRMEDGKLRSFPQSAQQEWRVGDPVRVVNGHLESRG